MNAVQKERASLIAHNDCKMALLAGLSVIRASWAAPVAYLVTPDATQAKKFTATEFIVAAANAIVAAPAGVVTTTLNGSVIERLRTPAEKKAYILRRAATWNDSASKGWADRPGDVRNQRLAVADPLFLIAQTINA